MMCSISYRVDPDYRCEEVFGYGEVLESIEQVLGGGGDGVGLGPSASQTSVAMKDVGYYN